MSRDARLKEELTTLRLLLSALMATDASIVAWLLQNFRKGDVVEVIVAWLATALVTGVFAGMLWLIFRHSKKLEVR